MADINYASVSLLLHCDGSNGSTTFTDSGPLGKTITGSGSVDISTTESKFGGASLKIDAGNKFLLADGSSDFAFGTGDFTIEMWVYLTDISNGYLYDCRPTSTTGNYPIIDLTYTSSKHHLRFSNDGGFRITSTSNIDNNTWTHLAICRVSGVTRAFTNGTQSGGDYTDTTNYINGTSRPAIRAFGFNTSNADALRGYIDDIRITKGVGRYASNFTPPTAAFPNYAVDPVAHSITGSTTINVLSSFVRTRVWNHAISGSSKINIIPYSTKVYVQHSHHITGNLRINVFPVSTLAHHATTNIAIAGLTTINVSPKSTLLWFTHNHTKTGTTTIKVTPATSTFTRAVYQGGNAALITPSLFAYATGYSEAPNSATLVLPGLIGTAVGGAIASGTLPSLLVIATGTQELHGTAEAILPALCAQATGQREYNGDAELVIAGFNASSFGAATAECVLPSFIVAGTGTAEFGSNTQVILPGLTLTATGQREYNGTAALILPGLRAGDIARASLVLPGLFVSATGSVSFANSVGYILNVHVNESYQWSNMNFLHIIRIGTDYYGVKKEGLYQLSTAYKTDAGTAIDATIKTKETDMGSYKSKRLQYAYLGSDTATVITPIVDGVTKPSHASAFGGRRTKMSLGNHGRYWQLEVSQIIELTGLELLPKELQRRVK